MNNCRPYRNYLQGLGTLPKELVIRIFSASVTPLPEQLRLLPSTYHTAVVHAAFPTIYGDRSVCVNSSDLENCAFAKALWPALSRINSFRTSRNESVNSFMSPQAASALGSQLAKLSCMQHLDLSNNSIGPGGAKWLGPHLAHLSSIQKLNLSFNHYRSYGAKSLGPHLAQLTSIQELNLNRTRTILEFHSQIRLRQKAYQMKALNQEKNYQASE